MELGPEGVVSDAGGVPSHSNGSSVVMTKDPIYLRRVLETVRGCPTCEFKGRRAEGETRTKAVYRIDGKLNMPNSIVQADGRSLALIMAMAMAMASNCRRRNGDRATKEIRQGRGRRKDHRFKDNMTTHGSGLGLSFQLSGDSERERHT